MQGCILCITDVAEIFCHDPVKNIVDPGQNRVTTSKVLMQLNLKGRAVLGLLRRIGMIFFQKEFRSCQTEAINALLHIPHHKHVMLTETFAGDCL